MLQPMKDHLAQVHPATKDDINNALRETLVAPSNNSLPDSLPSCTITILNRQANNRRIGNLDKLIDIINEVFDRNVWHVQTVSFDHASMRSQYLTMQSTLLFISVSRTGSHLAMFLPVGAVSVELSFMEHKMVNCGVCAVLSSLSCYIFSPEETGPVMKITDPCVL